MKRWVVPVITALLLAIGSYWLTLLVTPYALMDIAMRRVSALSPVNAMTHSPPVDARRQAIVRPSPDLLYSSCPFDLANGPLLVTAEPVPGRYSSISVFDARTDVAFVRNDEEMAGRPMRVVLALRGQMAPAGEEVVRLEMARGIVLQRVLLADPAEADGVDRLRRRTTCRPLAAAAG
jgi:uncharacterized membrane protein